MSKTLNVSSKTPRCKIPYSYDLIVDADDYEVLIHKSIHAGGIGNGLGFNICTGNSKTLTLGKFITGGSKGDDRYVLHKNCNKLDFRKDNLYVGEDANSLKDMKGSLGRNSKYIGVYYMKNDRQEYWSVRWKVLGKLKGKYFKSEEEAAAYWCLLNNQPKPILRTEVVKVLGMS